MFEYLDVLRRKCCHVWDEVFGLCTPLYVIEEREVGDEDIYFGFPIFFSLVDITSYQEMASDRVGILRLDEYCHSSVALEHLAFVPFFNRTVLIFSIR